MSYWSPSRGGGWAWTPGNPPKTLVDQFGLGTLTNPDVTPAGTQVHPAPPNSSTPENDSYPYGGYWEPNQGGAHWISNPPPLYRGRWKLLGLSWEEATNPDRNPRTGGDNPDYKGEKLANGKDNPYYVPPDVNAPKLTPKQGWPPDITGDVPRPPKDTRGGPPPPITAPPSHPRWWVDGSSIRDAETNILGAATNALHQYERLAAYVASTKSWIFAGPNPPKMVPHTVGGLGPDWIVTGDGAVATHRLGSASDNLLLNVADSIHSAGTYVEALNSAGQLYARADLDSFVPES